MLVDHGLQLLTEEDARALLTESDVGRVGVSMGAIPAIFPVNYAVLDDMIVFRTAPGSKLSAATSGAVVAFEVDDYDRNDRTGWSVLVVGRSEVVHDLDTTFKVLDAGLEPWADGFRSSIVRINIEMISGRRIIHTRGRQGVVDGAVDDELGASTR
jgi:nitroimidazol reductase NimA-like FMN-containing flavoprotein (pyridoxamine 5'-phosphate oxidase superfamily)